ncbi:MAG: hypothetical protein KGI29_01460 [Pseudomonadota bacterium]|nr:hypothetical protein [Pseudomonadota bacterium]MDE3038138.1 hypothetical protein [Pseudomonadota bacterium]
MSDQTSQAAADLTRIIVLIYGLLDSGGPFWLFAAVKPACYQPFLAAQKQGALDIYHFGSYGEIIVSGEGRTPPDTITLKVAEMYQTDPETLMQAMKDDKTSYAETQSS